jgi:hypothetical protein
MKNINSIWTYLGQGAVWNCQIQNPAVVLQSFTYCWIICHQKLPAVQLLKVRVLFNFLSRQYNNLLPGAERPFETFWPSADSEQQECLHIYSSWFNV